VSGRIPVSTYVGAVEARRLLRDPGARLGLYRGPHRNQGLGFAWGPITIPFPPEPSAGFHIAARFDSDVESRTCAKIQDLRHVLSTSEIDRLAE